MTHPWTPANPPDPAWDADRLGDAWDALVTGLRPTTPEADVELMAIVGQLSAEAQPIRPTLTFRNALRETLMHSGPMSMNAASSAPTFHPLPKLGRPVEIVMPAQRTAATPPRSLRRTGLHWAGIAAAIVLLLATAGYMGGAKLPGNGAGTTNIPAPVVESPTGAVAAVGESPSPTEAPEITPQPTLVPIAVESPTPTVVRTDVPPSPTPAGPAVDPCAAVGPSGVCGGPGPIIGQGLMSSYLYPDELPDGVKDVEMSEWSINPGQRAVFPTWAKPPPVLAMDVVIEGAYAATFSGPVIVARLGPLETRYEYPATGDLVELIPGDTVSYLWANRMEIVNPLATQTLVFKSIEFSSPVITPDAPLDPAVGQSIQGSYTMVIDGSGELPMALDAYPNGEVVIYVTYSQIGSNAPLPQDVARDIVLGPVESRTPSDASGGYTVWAYQLSG